MTRKTFTPAEMRELAKGRGSQFLMDDMRAALLYAADLIEAADRAINAARGTDPRPLGVFVSHGSSTTPVASQKQANLSDNAAGAKEDGNG